MTTEIVLPELVGTLASLSEHTQATIRAYGAACARTALQSPEIQALRKDAQRYRHLRDFMKTGPRDVFGVWWLSEHGHPPSLDEALDISMEQKP